MEAAGIDGKPAARVDNAASMVACNVGNAASMVNEMEMADRE